MKNKELIVRQLASRLIQSDINEDLILAVFFDVSGSINNRLMEHADIINNNVIEKVNSLTNIELSNNIRDIIDNRIDNETLSIAWKKIVFNVYRGDKDTRNFPIVTAKNPASLIRRFQRYKDILLKKDYTERLADTLKQKKITIAGKQLSDENIIRIIKSIQEKLYNKIDNNIRLIRQRQLQYDKKNAVDAGHYRGFINKMSDEMLADQYRYFLTLAQRVSVQSTLKKLSFLDSYFSLSEVQIETAEKSLITKNETDCLKEMMKEVIKEELADYGILSKKDMSEMINSIIKKPASPKKKIVEKLGTLPLDQSVTLIYIESQNQWYYKYPNTNKVQLSLSPICKKQLYSLMQSTIDERLYKTDGKIKFNKTSGVLLDRDDTHTQRDSRLRKELKNLLPYEFPSDPIDWGRKEKRYRFPNIDFLSYKETYEYDHSTTDFEADAGNPALKAQGLSEYKEKGKDK